MRFSLLLILMLLHNLAAAEKQDSLAIAVKRMANDSGKIHALSVLATKTADTTSAISYAKEMMSLSSQVGYAAGTALAWQTMGEINFKSHNFKTAIYFFEKGSGLYAGINHSRGQLRSHHWLARCYRRLADYTRYGKELAVLLDLSDRLGSQEYQAYAHEGYGNLYRYLGNYSKSIEHYTTAIRLSEKLRNLHDVSVALNNLSLVYGLLGQSAEELKIQLRNLSILRTQHGSANMVLCLSNLSGIYKGLNKMDSARYYIELAMRIIRYGGEEIVGFKDAASAYGEYAALASAAKDYLTAVEYYNKAIRLSQNNQDVKAIASGYHRLAEVFVLMGNKTMAEEYFFKSMEINKAIAYISGLIDNYRGLADFYAAEKNYPKAFLNMQLCAQLKDSLATITNSKKLAEAEVLYKVKEQQQEIFLLNQEKRMQQLERERERYLDYTLAVCLLVALLLIGMLFTRYRRRKVA